MAKPLKTEFEEFSSAAGLAFDELFNSSSSSDPGKISKKVIGLGGGDVFKGILLLLYKLGVVDFNHDGKLSVASKHSRFVIGSLRYLFNSSKRIPDIPDNRYGGKSFINVLTRTIEIARTMIFAKPEPIHSVDIVNVIIKGERVFNDKTEDVFLHMYHNSWHQYHMVGIGAKSTKMTTLDLANKSLQERLEIKTHQYRLNESIQLGDVRFNAISGSHGALTEYNCKGVVLESLEIDIQTKLDELTKKSPSYTEYSFKWFTLNEMRQGIGPNGEEIMESGARLLSTVKESFLPNSVGRIIKSAEPVFQYRGVVEENSQTKDPQTITDNSWLRRSLALLLALSIYLLGSIDFYQSMSFLAAYWIIFEFNPIYSFLTKKSGVRTALAEIAQIIGTIVAILLAFGVIS